MLTWTCHVCGEERPDHLIGVHKRPFLMDGVPIGTQNIRYCLDRPSCRDGAPNYSHFNEDLEKKLARHAFVEKDKDSR